MTVARITLDRHTVRQILDGTCTRAPKISDTEPQTGAGVIFRAGERRSACRIIVDQVEHTTLGDVFAGDSQLLGSPDGTEARRRWMAVHDRRVSRLTGEQQAALTADEILELFGRWTTIPAWLLVFRLDTSDHGRFLARTGKATGHKLVDRHGFARRVDATDDQARGYTTIPELSIDGAGEAVDDLTLARYTEQARERDAEREIASIDDLRRRLIAIAEPKDARDVRVVLDRLARMEQARRRAA